MSRRLIVVLGDQLSRRLRTFRDFDTKSDVVWMAEVSGESEYVWSAKQRTVFFLSAMRHFREELRTDGVRVHYTEIGDAGSEGSLGEQLGSFLKDNEFEEVVMTEPGEFRLIEAMERACEAAGIALRWEEDDSFYCSRERFERHAEGRKQLRMEYFYREMRKEHGVLLDEEGEPEGGKWNYDASNRESFGKEGPERLLPRVRFEVDAITREVMGTVELNFAKHPGNLDTFGWPVTRKDALEALRHFIEDELGQFGRYQDAMWTGEPFLHHSLLAAAMNVKLIDAKEVVEAAEAEYRKGRVPLESVEGFVRQILGWREYVRGIYWRFMPDYLERNALDAKEALPSFYWDGETEMRCLSEAIGQTLKFGYAHHIQRLMVTGLFALLFGVRPKAVHEWYLAVYVDAVEWVELPNTLGMSQFGDGGVMASKPYVATGKYIQRMSNYCGNCRYRPDKRTGESACPFTTLYWDFLDRHAERLKGNPRMSMQLRNLERVKSSEMKAIKEQAETIRERYRK